MEVLKMLAVGTALRQTAGITLGLAYNTKDVSLVISDKMSGASSKISISDTCHQLWINTDATLQQWDVWLGTPTYFTIKNDTI